MRPPLADGPSPNSTDPERARLVEALARVARGDRAAFHEVYQRTSAKLLGVTARIFADRDEAEDVLQDIYLTIWRKAGQFDASRASPITWMVTIARNRAIDRLRARGRAPTTPIDAVAEPEDDSDSVLETMIAQEGDARVVWCVGQLRGTEAELIRNAFFQGSTYSELADRAATPLSTIKSRIRRALMRLRACLEPGPA